MNGILATLSFKASCLWFGLRDQRTPPETFLAEARLAAGNTVLDYGCGCGSYTLAAARMVGPAGAVYAIDINPLAVHNARRQAEQQGLRNVTAVQTDCATGLPDASIDVALLYDVYHDLGDPQAVLRELWRVLRADGRLSFSDHHLKPAEVTDRATASGLFAPAGHGVHTDTFHKVTQHAAKG